MSAISVSNLTKRYGDLQAVKGISFDVPEGSFFAFLGPNGAGKSTTISIICSLMEHDSGDVTIFGRDVSDPAVRRDVGIVFQDPMLDSKLTVRENVRVRGALYGLRKDDLEAATDRAITIADAEEFADRAYGTLSGGQRRRADIARALVHSPRILLLDEPTAGLDPQTRKHIWDTVTSLNRDSGMTVLLTTHYMEEAADADDVVIINKGAIVAHGTPAQLRDRYCSDYMLISPIDKNAVVSILDSMGLEHEDKGAAIKVRLQSTVDSVPVVKALEGMMESFEVRMGSLDDAFINITGEAME